jgi:hypothetical protein
MDYEPFNSLSYDEEILKDKLGLSYDGEMHKRALEKSMEQRIKDKLAEHEMTERKMRKNTQNNMHDRVPVREHFVASMGGCGCDGFKATKRPVVEGCATCGGMKNKPSYAEGYCTSNGGGNNNADDDIPVFNNNKILWILIFVLAIFCMVQHMNQQQLSNDMQMLMSSLYGNRGGTGGVGQPLLQQAAVQPQMPVQPQQAPVV